MLYHPIKTLIQIDDTAITICMSVHMYTAVHQSNPSVVDEFRRYFIGCLWLVCVIVGSLWCNDEAGGLISHTAE